MQFYTKPAAIARMNEWGATKTPFLFFIDYLQERCYVEQVSEVDAASCLYDFQGKSNAPLPVAPYKGELLWQVTPPDRARYGSSLRYVKEQIYGGNSFLANLTCRVPLQTNLSLRDIYNHAHARYKLWVKDQFVCFSPEIFVRIKEGSIYSYPMKGTLSAQLPQAEQQLMNDPKEAAEHATIVDLIRNDLSMVATQVEVLNYRYCDYLQTNKGEIIQTSSEICGRLPQHYHTSLGDTLFALLPAGSITGAPKVKTMQIIEAAEGYARNFYTGIMGIFDGEELDSAVMIRFIEQEADGHYYFKAGGGITSQSEEESEYNEIVAKVYVPFS
ncbi:MAG: aminodeoxychorismate synthase component I [Phocaeicola sp.]